LPLLRSKLAILTDGEIADGDFADSGTHQLEDLRSDRLHHAAHLAIAAFGDRDFEESASRRHATGLVIDDVD